MSALSENDPAGREDPLHYAPRWLREKPEQRFSVIEELRPSQERRPDNQSRSMSAPSPLDAQLEGAVYESLRRQLDPEVMEEPSGLARELDRRDALFGVAGRFALAIGVSALVAVFFVYMIPASHQPNPAASLAGTIEQMKAALSMTPSPQRDDANASPIANASANASGISIPNSNGISIPASISVPNSNVGEPQAVRASNDTPAVTNEQSEKLLQQFMKWQQKPAQ